jgi:hypothetical protein
MADIRLFPRIFGEVMTNVIALYDPTNGLMPAYEFGTYEELTKRVVIKNRNIAAGKVEVKYPLVWLVWEAAESKRTYTADLIAKVQPRIFVCNSTKGDYSSSQRYTVNFETVLFPIWDLVFNELNNHSQIGKVKKEDYTDYDHLFWGESLGHAKKKNVIFDTLDALEVKFVDDIRILPEKC